MLLTARPLRFLEMALDFFPDKRWFQQFSFVWKNKRNIKTMWFLQVSQKLADGRDPNWSPGRKNRVSVCVLHCVWQGPAGQQTHVPQFLQEQPGSNETDHTSLAAQHKQDQSRMLCSLWDMGNHPRPGARVEAGPGCAGQLLLVCSDGALGVLRNLGQSTERLEDKILRNTVFIHSSVLNSE